MVELVQSPAVPPVIEHHRERIADLCRKYRVRVLELFGSAARGGDFDPATSDFDFLVVYIDHGDFRWFEQVTGLREELEALLGRKVDVVDLAGARNPYFIASALRHRERVYAA